MQKLNFPTSSIYDIITRDGSEMILDSLRQKYVVLTPEEWVQRRNLAETRIPGEIKLPYLSSFRRWSIAAAGLTLLVAAACQMESGV
ncbi:MAG: hypothetical protein OXC45_06690, partial [Gemmatimonadetes bacterium]|nr:hypothetical protein [Gemmatimonadota bacterium]